MSTISSWSTSVTVYTPTTSQVSSPNDPDGDGDNHRGGGRVHHGHRGEGPGGGMAQQLQAALRSVGLTVPTTSSASSSSTDAPTGTTSLRKDMHEFMHQLFVASRQAQGGSASTPSGGDAGKNSFAQGLAAVLSEVSSGNAPSGLQSAFDQLKSDLTAGGGASGSSATLQELLTQLQSSIGYSGTPATGAASGVAVNTVA